MSLDTNIRFVDSDLDALSVYRSVRELLGATVDGYSRHDHGDEWYYQHSVCGSKAAVSLCVGKQPSQNLVGGEGAPMDWYSFEIRLDSTFGVENAAEKTHKAVVDWLLEQYPAEQVWIEVPSYGYWGYRVTPYEV